MTFKKICSIREVTEAGTIHSFLESRGFHPRPLDTSSHITGVGGADLWYHIEVPGSEKAEAQRILEQCGWGRALVR